MISLANGAAEDRCRAAQLGQIDRGSHRCRPPRLLDLCTGANDNAADVVATIEVARALRALPRRPRRPRRTIRFVLLTGEEQGSLGARAFIRRHHARLNAINAVLVMDSGSGRMTGVSLEGCEALRPAWDKAAADAAIQDFTVTRQGEGDSDQLPFVACGVPAFEFIQADSGYDRLHHSEIDTLEHVDFKGLTAATQTLAKLTWHFATTRERLSR